MPVNIIRRGTTFNLLCQALSEFVESDLEMTIDKPHPDAMRRIGRILDLFKWDDPSLGDLELLHGHGAREKLKSTREEFETMFSATDFETYKL